MTLTHWPTEVTHSVNAGQARCNGSGSLSADPPVYFRRSEGVTHWPCTTYTRTVGHGTVRVRNVGAR